MMLVQNRSAKSVVILSGSPSPTSKTAKVGDFIADWLVRQDLAATHLRVRDISPAALLGCDMTDASLKAAVDAVAGADGIVLATPTFKASFSGLLKAFLDVLPQFGFRGKVVMPFGTGGSLAHVLSLDYGLRPVVQSMRPRLIAPSVFVLEQDIRTEGASLDIDPRSKGYLLEILEEFAQALAHAPAAIAPERPAATLRAIG